MIPIIDIFVFAAAVALNLLMVGLFTARILKKTRLEHYLGLIVVALAVPLSASVFINWIAGRAWWWVVLPVFAILFLILEWLLDYVLKVEFRKTRLVWPYSILYYLGLLGLLGYAFAMGKLTGFIVLITYFANLAAVWIAHRK